MNLLQKQNKGAIQVQSGVGELYEKPSCIHFREFKVKNVLGESLLLAKSINRLIK